ncbi:hypothetical protein GOP47_0027754 [Adiantum capillus-veneris]|nr:hypothetical protein GOP47_0027754 [Adiantum capillus-veneris]
MRAGHFNDRANFSKRVQPRLQRTRSSSEAFCVIAGGMAMSSDVPSASPNITPVKKSLKRPRDSRFLQQQLPACKPLLTPGWVITIYLLIGVIFVPIGVFSLLASKHVVEIVDRYDAVCEPPAYATDKVNASQATDANNTCTRTLTVPRHMKQPIYVYYELTNYYQNHRRYVKTEFTRQCISWKSDREHKFGANVKPRNFPNNVNESGVWIGGASLDPNKPLNEDEDLLVWMRTAALPDFRKLYGRIERDLTANKRITVNIRNVYNTYSFGGHKKLVLSTTSWLGGKNDFLGIAYLVVGSFSVFLALVFLGAHSTNKRAFGDINYLSWNRST